MINYVNMFMLVGFCLFRARKNYLIIGIWVTILSTFQPVRGQAFFDPVRGLSKPQQFDTVCAIYYNRIIRLDSAQACGALAQLRTMPGEDNNPLLQAIFYALSGDYYAKIGHASKATTFLQQALAESDKHSLYSVQVLVHQLLGEIQYDRLKDSLIAFSELLAANDLVRNRLGYRNYYLSAQLLSKIGFIYFDFSNYQQAKEYFVSSVRYRFTNPNDQVNVYNTIGIIYLKTSQPDSATHYFETALSIARNNHLDAWIGVTGGNLGYVYYKQKKYADAALFMRRDVDVSLLNKEWSSAAAALSSLAEIDIIQGHTGLASRRLDSAKTLLVLQDNLSGRYKLLSVLSLLYASRKQFDSAYHSSDSALQLFREISESNKSMVLNGAEKKSELDKHVAALKLLQAKSQSQVNRRNYIILTFILILIILIQVTYRIRAKFKKEQQALGELKARLFEYVNNIREKNVVILECKEKIDSLTLLTESQEEKKEEITDKLKNFTILTEDQWNEFRHLFEKVHKNFTRHLQAEHKNLTPSEVRLLMLLKLNLSKTEMADMLGVSPDSIKKTRQRIYKKISLPENIRLEQFVSDL